MIRRQNHSIILFLFAILLLSLAIGGCRSANEGFAIYLSAQDVRPQDMSQVELSSVQLADTPLISVDDIVSYSGETHEIKLTPGAFADIQSLQLPSGGTVFIVCVDSKPIYWGGFWSELQLMLRCAGPPDGVTCAIPGNTSYMGHEANSIELSFYSYDWKASDPRSNPEIITSLERAGKLY